MGGTTQDLRERMGNFEMQTAEQYIDKVRFHVAPTR